jgi:hypothetical protein
MKGATRKKLPAGARRLAVRRDEEGRRLISHIDLLRMRLSAAAKAWKEAKEQASQAKRRRKLAKLMARRAKKDAKTAKANMDELREALLQARRSAAIATARPSSRKLSTGRQALPTSKRKPGPGRATRKSSPAKRKPGAHFPPIPLPAAIAETETILSDPVGASVPEGHENILPGR